MMSTPDAVDRQMREPRRKAAERPATDQEPKTALIVYAHPEPKSFNGAMKETAVRALTRAGYSIVISDLYEMQFNPVAGKGDIAGDLRDPNYFRQGEEASLAYAQGRLAPDVAAEAKKLKDASLVIFQFPMYWLSMPAIMKGWIDRVMIDGFAFTEGRWHSTGLLKGKRALLSLTTGGPQAMYSSTGMQGDISVILYPIQSGVLGFCGFDVLPPQVSYDVPFIDDKARKTALSKWRQRLLKIDSEQPLPPVDAAMFDPRRGFCLSAAAEAQQRDKTHGLSIGTHLGKPLPLSLVFSG